MSGYYYNVCVDIIVGCLLAFLVARFVRFVQKRHGNQASRGTQSVFLPLPNEIVLEIFSHLPQSALDQLRLVNRAANSLVGHPQRMVLNSPGQSSLARAVTTALDSSPEIFSKLRKLVIVVNDDLDQAKAGGYWLLGPPSTMARLVCDDDLVPAIGVLMVSDF
ncbi:hypothetical protein PG984_014896 [Apiospora sp. TS-2023a]